MLNWIFKRLKQDVNDNLTEGAKDFLEGRKNTLSSADLNPEGTKLYANFLQAMEFKKQGKLEDAERLLIKSCIPASIYKGHYRELFRIWRQFNRSDIGRKKYKQVRERVLTMIRFDDEMISVMLHHYSGAQNRELPRDYFDKDRNLLVSDAKVLKKAAQKLNDMENESLANDLVQRFSLFA